MFLSVHAVSGLCPTGHIPDQPLSAALHGAELGSVGLPTKPLPPYRAEAHLNLHDFSEENSMSNVQLLMLQINLEFDCPGRYGKLISRNGLQSLYSL
jgi:hypothetical protein